MRLTLSARSPIRSFYDPISHRLTIVSDVVDDDAEGRVYGKRVAIAFSATGEFRDLEVVPGAVSSGGPEAGVLSPLPTGDPVEVWIPETDEPAIEETSGSAAITVRLLPAVPERWVQLRGSGVLLGLVDEDVLAAIRVEPDLDPNGELEAQWLQSLGD
jgi:hypothetical protein